MSFADFGRQMLLAEIEHRLGDRAGRHNLISLTEAYVQRFGFYNIDEPEVGWQAFEALAAEHALPKL